MRYMKAYVMFFDAVMYMHLLIPQIGTPYTYMQVITSEMVGWQSFSYTYN